tara:strand:- start:860 stop:1843 length:984 start_codon:yes stop_codon:yes gene_type:complete
MLLLILAISLLKAEGPSLCTKANALSVLADNNKQLIHTKKLQNLIQNADTKESNWCLVESVLKKSGNQNGLDEWLTVRDILNSDLEAVTAQGLMLVDHLIDNASNGNEVDESKWISLILKREVVIDNTEKLNLIKTVFTNAAVSNQMDDNKLFRIIASIDEIDKDKKDFLQAAIYTSQRKGVQSRTVVLSSLENLKKYGQDFLDSIGYDKMKLYTILFLGERQHNRVKEAAIYSGLEEVVIFEEQEYLCLASKLIHYLDKKTKDQPRYMANNQASKMLTDSTRKNCKGIPILNENEIDKHIDKELKSAKEEYERHNQKPLQKISLAP